jgi:2-C-methyl-D-erythritol 4-phosphate cytidylyltransferase
MFVRREFGSKLTALRGGGGFAAHLSRERKHMPGIVAILPAAGLGTRMGGESPKQFRLLDGVPVLQFTLRRLAACPSITEFLVATREDEVQPLTARLSSEQLGRPLRVVAGGDNRQESVRKALAQAPADADLILVHDAVRPLVTRDQIDRVIAEARTRHAAILGIPAMDTVKEVKRASLPGDVALITATIPRERVVLAQTPQVFAAALLREALARATADGFTGSDEAGLVERLGHDVYVVQGSERNIKITRPGDLELAEFYLRQERAHAAGAK